MTREYKLAVIGGDGIGPEVTNIALEALELATRGSGVNFVTTEYDLGARRWHATGETLPDSVLAEIRGHLTLPVGVGFGIRDAASAQAIAAEADAVVIGSRLIQEIEAGPADAAAERAGAWLAGIRKALDTMRRRAA